ncbi:MAG: pyridoxamine 5'-phosphate oxidase family protein [Bacillota bacterium]
MANRVEPKLIPALFEELQQERFITVSTVNHLSGGPNVRAISWVYAQSEERILFAVDSRSRIVKDIKFNPLVVLNIIANESSYSVYGKAVLISKTLLNIPINLSLISLDIEEVRDVMFYGSRISVEPQYEKTYDNEAAGRLDLQVIEAMKKA